jgi:hypothetical protein
VALFIAFIHKYSSYYYFEQIVLILPVQRTTKSKSGSMSILVRVGVRQHFSMMILNKFILEMFRAP